MRLLTLGFDSAPLAALSGVDFSTVQGEAAGRMDLACIGYYVRLRALAKVQADLHSDDVNESCYLNLSLTQEAAVCGVRKARVEGWLGLLQQNGLLRFVVTPRGTQVTLRNDERPTVQVNLTTGSHGNRSVPMGPDQFPREPISSHGTQSAPRYALARVEEEVRLKTKTKTKTENNSSLAACGSEQATFVLTDPVGNAAERVEAVGGAPDSPAPSADATPSQTRRGRSGALRLSSLPPEFLKQLDEIYSIYPRLHGRREYPSKGYEELLKRGFRASDLPALKQAAERCRDRRDPYPLCWHNWVRTWRDELRQDASAASNQNKLTLINMDDVYGETK